MLLPREIMMIDENMKVMAMLLASHYSTQFKVVNQLPPPLIRFWSIDG